MTGAIGLAAATFEFSEVVPGLVKKSRLKDVLEFGSNVKDDFTFF